MTSKSSHRRGGNGVCPKIKYKISHSRGGLLLYGSLLQEQEEPQPLKYQATMEERRTAVRPLLLSFLQKDDSFLCPWNWGSKALRNEASGSSRDTKTQYLQLQFQPGSFFASEVFDCKRI